MSDLIFIIRTFVITAIVVACMQIQVGRYTLEDHTVQMIERSAAMQPVREAAHGGAVLVRQVWHKVTGLFNSKISSSLRSDSFPGSRSLGVQIDRSKKYLEEQAERLRKKKEEAEKN